MGYTVALDVGGTFTDVALLHEASGRLWVTKTPTTSHDVSAGFITGIDKALRLAGVEAASLRHVVHGTTTATNAILEGKGAATGLLTTAGFRYVLEIGRHDIPRRANMFAWVKPARPVSPELIFEIGGRVTVEGEELEPLDETGLRAAARRFGEAAGFADLISVDVGGTSADVCLVRGGEAEVTVEGRVGAWPLHVPMLDIHTIGAGGGSIARVTDDGMLTVGPESAGAQPGPVCYGAGGEEPTVTDAHLVLGRIPSHLLGGEITLDVERARRAVEERVAQPLGLPLAAAAQGILDIVNNNMVGALRLVSVERGYD